MILDERGSASVEFLFITLVVLIILGGFVSLVANEMGQTSTGNLAQARMTGEMAAETINTVYTNGIGYSVNLTVPNNMNITVNNPNGYVTVNSAGQSVSVKIIPLNIQNVNLASGNHVVTNNATNGSYLITFN